MTPNQLQSVADGWAARAIQCIENGEREAAAVYAECAKSLSRYLPSKPVEAPRPAPKAPPAMGPAVEAEKVPKGVMGRPSGR